MKNAQLLTTLTSSIATAFVANNSVPAAEVGTIIRLIYEGLSNAALPQIAPAPTYIGATTVRKSLANPDKLISMIDGKAYSSLKRHLSSQGITPEIYRSRYDLPHDYPMVAPGYSLKRRALSIQGGLGRTSMPIESHSDGTPAHNTDAKLKKRKPFTIAAPKGSQTKDLAPHRSR